MIESFTEDFKTYSVLSSLDVAKCFSKGVCSIVTLEVDGFRPCFDHSVDCLDGERLVIS